MAADPPGKEVSPPPVLELLLKETPQPNYGAPVPQEITGRVLQRSEGISSGVSGVSVTDGYSVVKTDALGAYALKPHSSAVFVYLTRPAGFNVRGSWYQPLAAQVDFLLEPSREDENEYTFVHVTDTHITANRRSLEGLSQFVREINALTPKPRFVVNSGDLLNLHKALVTSPAAGRADFRNYVGIMNHLQMPYYNVAGDHTDSSYRIEQFPRGDHRCGKPLYWEHLGPHFFSFEYGKIHFMSIDFGYHLGQNQRRVNGKDLEYPTLTVQPPHVEWMRQDMAHRSKDTFVITTAEHDLAEHCPGFLELAKQHDVRLQLVGDHHVVSYKSRPVPYRVGGALAGCWWNPKAGRLCPDLSPQGYMIYHVSGEKLEHFYKGLDQRIAITSHRVGAPWSGQVNLQAHLVQPLPQETLEYSIDGVSWKPMQEIDRPFYRARFSASINTAALPEGKITLRVRSTASDEVRSQDIVVANGGAPLPSPKQGMLSFTVGEDTGWTAPRSPAGKVDVLFNEKVVGVLEPKRGKTYELTIKASQIGVANTLAFRFAEPTDGMSISSPFLTIEERTIRDPRDEAIRKVRIGHWGKQAADWGGFIVGAAHPPDETPFHRTQNVFCFVVDTE